jgi:tRNA A37 threonylcarbamoyladenosine modification protein TsaB
VSGHPQPAPALWLDASSIETSLALLRDGQLLSLRTSADNALDSLFTVLDACLHEHGLAFDDLSTLHYCGGPGSTLGLRIAAMARKTWKTLRPGLRLRTCNSLPLQTALLAQEPDAPARFTLVAQHRKGLWYKTEHHAGQPLQTTPDTLADEDIPQLQGTVFHMQQRTFATPPPEHFQPMPLHLRNLPAILHADGLFREVEQPELFDTGTPTFQKWTPARHTKPTSN